MGWITTDMIPTENGAIDRLGNRYRIANGYLEYRGTLEEFTKEQKPATLVPELMNRCSSQCREVVNIPNGGYIQPVVDGVPLHVLSSRVLAHTQALHIDHDIHFRRTIFANGDGSMILVRARRFASLLLPHLLCMEYILQPSRECTITIRTGIDGDVWELNGPHLESFHALSDGGTLSLTAQTHAHAAPAARIVPAAQMMPAAQIVPVVVSECSLIEEGERVLVQEEKRIFHEIRVRVGRYQPVVLTKFVAVFTGVDTDDPLRDGKNLCNNAAQMGIETLYQEHCALWDKRWRDHRWMPRYGAPDQQPRDLAFSSDLG